MNVLLISTYELGRQPFGLASPVAWLRQAGHQVTCQDLSQERLNPERVREAQLIAFYLPMHTATRIALQAIRRVRTLNAGAHLCCYGLYAPPNAELLRSRGVATILSGEFEQDLLALADSLSGHNAAADAASQSALTAANARQATSAIPKLHFLAPDRAGLPPV